MSVGAELAVVGAKFARAGVPVRVEADGSLTIRAGDDLIVIRVMADPGHPNRVHLRSRTVDDREVTLTSERMEKVNKLVEYSKGLIAAAERAKK